MKEIPVYIPRYLTPELQDRRYVLESDYLEAVNEAYQQGCTNAVRDSRDE